MAIVIKRRRKRGIPIEQWRLTPLKICHDEHSERLKKTLELMMDFFENESTLYVNNARAKCYSDFTIEQCLPLLAKGCTPTQRALLSVLRGCLISHRFTDAARMLDVLSFDNTKKTNYFLYKSAFEVLLNHPDSTPDVIDYFVRSILFLYGVNKREIILEYLTYLLKNRQPVEIRAAQQVLPVVVTLKQNPIIDPLMKAYSVLVDYICWAELKWLGTAEQIHVAEMKRLKERILQVWLPAVQLEGQWDIFIPKLIEILEFHNEIDEAESVLEKHISTNENSLYSFVFFYEYLKKHGRNGNRQLECLKNICSLSPSDPLVLELAEILLQENKIKKALRLLIKFVDYADNKNDLTCWNMLSSICLSAFERSSSKTIKCLKKTWRKNCPHWSLYHFNPNSVSVSNVEDVKLLLHKSLFLLIVQGDKIIPYIEVVVEHLADYPHYEKKLQRLKIKIATLHL